MAARGSPPTDDQELRETSSQPLVWPSPQTSFTAPTAAGSPWCWNSRRPATAALESAQARATTSRNFELAPKIPP